MHIFSILLMLVTILNILLAAVIVFRERRDASSTWAWLLVLVFIPLGGFFLYLLFGRNLSRHRLFQWDDRKKLGLEKTLKSQMKHLRDGSFEFCNEPERASQDLIYMQLVNNEAPFSRDNSVEIFTDGGKKFENLIQDIERAEHHIHLQYYIIKKDNLGRKIRDVLVEKAKQGVKVRVLYDELGSRRLTKRFFSELRKAGGEVEVFFPTRFAFINFRMNYRNHRKIVIIDGKIGYVGGFNVGDEYLGLNPRFGFWRDTHLKIQGTAVHSMQTRFILDWNQASYGHDIDYDPVLFPEEIGKGAIGMQIVTSGPESEWPQIKDGYIKMISLAKHSITIQTPYFVPDASLLDTLRIACHSGVDVKIMIPNKPDHLFVYWASLSNIGDLLKAGAKVYIYDNGFIHAKSIVVDDEISSVGTANFDIRSLKLNFEINAFIYNKTIAKKLMDAFHEDVKLSRKLTWEQYQERSKWIRFRESISRLLSPLL
ncbi:MULTISPECIES: cardiolipin synthase [unclassified Fictibacillus]|uniref:cardiolipin synthase n=1 Tax=unclassified Fictibacillus TaxID=2644029 RepID=UPI00223D6AB2|nr:MULTISPECIES: cardiolipin synthase [unclassified Fictibacillus]MED2971026.1 cardiolipin synthase [Fictibacillus sp. B-59209]UZJ79754.1 cardiolipin synthase [Fictibacillus sp. KU28468]